MLSTANANRFIRSVAIPLVIVAYAVFVWIDQDRNDDPVIKEHIRQIKKSSSVEGIVFGGSNGLYSLSAQLLTSHFGVRWYNASINAEMHRVDRYNDFIRDLATNIDRKKVKYVVYSSQFPYLSGSISVHESTKIEKVNGLGIKPKKSLLAYILGINYDKMSLVSYIMNIYRNQHAKILRQEHLDEFGDLIFENFKCEFDGRTNHEREEEDISAEFLTKQAIFFSSVFPYASIFIVLPSEYYGENKFDDTVWEQDLQEKFYNALSQKHRFKAAAVKIVVQPPYASAGQICNRQEHANEQGRLWRTRNLIDFIAPFVVTQK